MRVILCDVGPRDGLQNEPEALPPETRAELVERLAAAGLPRIEAVSFVRDDRVPQMAGAEEVVEHVQRRDGVELSGLVLNERGWERFAARGPRPGERHASRRPRPSTCATGTRRSPRRSSGLTRSSLRRGETPATVTISCSFGCPVRGACGPGRRRGARWAIRGPSGGRPRRHDRRRDAVRGPLARRAGAGRRLPRPQHAQHRLRELPRCTRGGRARARRVGRRPRRLPFLAARDGERRDGGSGLPARGGGRRRPASTSTRSSASRSGSRASSAGSWRATSIVPAPGPLGPVHPRTDCH